MTGWERIGVVLSLLFGVPAFYIAYDMNSKAYGYVYPDEVVKTLKGQLFWDSLYLQAQKERPELYKGCIQRSVEMTAPSNNYGGYTITCEKTWKHAFKESIIWGFLPAILIWGIGLTIGWIVQGFRQSK